MCALTILCRKFIMAGISFIRFTISPLLSAFAGKHQRGENENREYRFHRIKAVFYKMQHPVKFHKT